MNGLDENGSIMTDDPNSYSAFLQQHQAASSSFDYSPDTPSTATPFLNSNQPQSHRSHRQGSYHAQQMSDSGVDEWGSPSTPSSTATFSHHSLQPSSTSTYAASSYDASSSSTVRSTYSPYTSSSSNPNQSYPHSGTISRTASFSGSVGAGPPSAVWPPYPTDAGGKNESGGRRSLSGGGVDDIGGVGSTRGGSGMGGVGSSGGIGSGTGSGGIGGNVAMGEAERLAKRKSEKEKWIELGELVGKVDERIKVRIQFIFSSRTSFSKSLRVSSSFLFRVASDFTSSSENTTCTQDGFTPSLNQPLSISIHYTHRPLLSFLIPTVIPASFATISPSTSTSSERISSFVANFQELWLVFFVTRRWRRRTSPVASAGRGLW